MNSGLSCSRRATRPGSVHARMNGLALCRRTRQVVAVAVGDRSEKTCRRLWERIPAEYRKKQAYTDFWDQPLACKWAGEAYYCVVPERQHRPGGKDEGQTNHVERCARSASTTRFGSGSAVSCVKHSRSASVPRCTGGAYCCSCTSTTKLASSGLPKRRQNNQRRATTKSIAPLALRRWLPICCFILSGVCARDAGISWRAFGAAKGVFRDSTALCSRGHKKPPRRY